MSKPLTTLALFLDAFCASGEGRVEHTEKPSTLLVYFLKKATLGVLRPARKSCGGGVSSSACGMSCVFLRKNTASVV